MVQHMLSTVGRPHGETVIIVLRLPPRRTVTNLGSRTWGRITSPIEVDPSGKRDYGQELASEKAHAEQDRRTQGRRGRC